MYVIPAPGMAVRDPVLRDLLPAEGREVGDAAYWVRRLRDGDVTEGAPPAAPAEPEPAAPAAAEQEG